MQQLDVGALIQAVATIVALVGVIVSFALTRRGQKQDLELAREQATRAERAQQAGEASAERAEKAASLTIDSLTRMADALDKIGSQGLSGGTVLAAAVPERVAWSLTHFQGDTYMLENVGTGVAHDVVVSADETLLQPGEWPREETMRPSDNVTFMAVLTFGTRDSTITVTWNNDDGEPDTWRYPLPPRPPR